MMKRWFGIAALLAGMFITLPAQAQMFAGLTENLARTRMLLLPVEALAARSRAQASKEKKAPRAAANRKNAAASDKSASAAPVASTGYTASPQVTARVKRQFVDWLKVTTGMDQNAEHAVMQEDFLHSWKTAVQADGLRPNDTADALASYWVLNWMIAKGRASNTAEEAQAVRDQCRDLLSANPAFARLTAVQKQELAEIWMMNFVIQAAAYSDALKRGDQELLPKLAKAAQTRFRNEMGLDLSRLRITSRGFAPA